jgi:exocyst complex protein 7
MSHDRFVSFLWTIRALPWDPNIGEEAGEMDSYVKYLVLRIRSNLARKSERYAAEPGDLAQVRRILASRNPLRCSLELTRRFVTYTQAKSHMFMINNTYYLLRNLRPRSKKQEEETKDKDEAEYYKMEGSWFENDVRKVFEAERSKYLKLWEPLNQWAVVVETKGNNPSNEESRLLKTRFMGFNDEFEKLHTLHMGLSVADSSLRRNLHSEVKGVFFPRYQRFYEKCSTIKFSKKKQDEYLKYPPAKAEQMIGDLFQSAK